MQSKHWFSSSKCFWSADISNSINQLTCSKLAIPGCDFILQDEQKELDEITAKRQKKGRNEEEAPAEEKTILHGTVGQ